MFILSFSLCFQNKRMQMGSSIYCDDILLFRMFIAIVEKNYDVSFFGNMENEDAFVGRIDSYEFRVVGYGDILCLILVYCL